ncbi:hypothetical protein Bca4012_062824 [Brassica carinata]
MKKIRPGVFDVHVSRGGRSDSGEARDDRVLRDGDGGIRDSCHRRVDGVRDPGLEEEIVGSSSCGGEQRDEAAEIRGDIEFTGYRCVFLAKNKSECLQEDKATKIPVSQILNPNNTLLKQVDPDNRLIDALEMMKQGVRRLLVSKSVVWRGMSKRFSILYNGKWLMNRENSNSSSGLSSNYSSRPSTSKASSRDKFCCLSREDMIRFLIGVLGALAPLPLKSISSLGIINVYYNFIQASFPEIEATKSHCVILVRSLYWNKPKTKNSSR